MAQAPEVKLPKLTAPEIHRIATAINLLLKSNERAVNANSQRPAIADAIREEIRDLEAIKTKIMQKGFWE